MDRVVVSVVILFSLICGIHGFSYSIESDLRTLLYTTNSYELMSRPEQLVRVNISFMPLVLNELDIVSESMTMTGYFQFKWEDSRLDWTSQATYNGIPYIFSTSAKTWRPTLIVANGIDGVSIIDDSTNMIRVLQNGNIIWTQPMLLHTDCTMDITFYPFDTQVCAIELSTWSYTSGELDLAFDDPDVVTDFLNFNGEWTYIEYSVTDSTTNRWTIDYDIVKINFTFLRRPVFMFTNIIMPVVVLAFLSCFVFKLPTDNKIDFSLTVMLAYAVYLTLVSDHMPTTSVNTPVLGVYNIFILFLDVLSILLTTFVLHCNNQPDDKPVPRWLRNVTKLFVTGSNRCRGRKDKVSTVHIDVKEPGDCYKEKDKENDTEILSWNDIFIMFDNFFFWLYIVVVTVATAMLFIALIFGYCTKYHSE